MGWEQGCAVNFCHLDGLLWVLDAQRHSWVYWGQPAVEILTVGSRSRSGLLPSGLPLTCSIQTTGAGGCSSSALTFITTVPKERSCPVPEVGGTAVHVHAGRWLSISARLWTWRAEGGGGRGRREEGLRAGVLSRNCRSSVWFIEETSVVRPWFLSGVLDLKQLPLGSVLVRPALRCHVPLSPFTLVSSQ